MPGPELTDDAILELADTMVRELALTEDDRDVITLRIQRLIWPPSPWYFLHDRPHVVLEIGQHDGGGWHGELLCPHGCTRRWRVNRGPSEEAVYKALTAAHEEYRTGRTAAVSPPTPGEHRLRSLDDLIGGNRAEYVEVHDERLTS